MKLVLETVRNVIGLPKGELLPRIRIALPSGQPVDVVWDGSECKARGGAMMGTCTDLEFRTPEDKNGLSGSVRVDGLAGLIGAKFLSWPHTGPEGEARGTDLVYLAFEEDGQALVLLDAMRGLNESVQL